jgi:O-antigen/teichoic acid export membrane protein
MGEPTNLRVKVTISALWSAVRIASDQVAGFVIFLLLARLLTPADFGVVAIAVAIVELSKVAVSNGLAEAVIQTPDLDEEFASSCFWMSVGGSVLFMLAIMLAAGPAASLFASPVLAPALVVVSLTLPVSALGAMHGARLAREFGHRAFALRSLVSNLVGGAVAVVLALSDYGLWSLVVQRLVVEVLVTGLTWYAFPWLPRLMVGSAVLRRAGRFGAHVVGAQLLFHAAVRIQEFIIGLLVSLSGVGHFRLAWRMLETMSQVSIRPITTAAGPAFARLQHDRAALSRAYLRMLGFSSLFTFPAFLGGALLGQDAIVLLVGEKWRLAATIFEILCLLVLPISLNFFAGPALNAAGRPQVLVRIAAVQLVLGVILLVAAAPFGMIAVAWSHVLRAYLTTPYVLWCIGRETGITVRQQLSVVLAPAAAALGMSVVVIVARPILAGDLSPLVQTVAMAGVGAVAYALLLVMFGRKALLDHFRFLRSLVARKPD